MPTPIFEDTIESEGVDNPSISDKQVPKESTFNEFEGFVADIPDTGIHYKEVIAKNWQLAKKIFEQKILPTLKGKVIPEPIINLWNTSIMATIMFNILKTKHPELADDRKLADLISKYYDRLELKVEKMKEREIKVKSQKFLLSLQQEQFYQFVRQSTLDFLKSES